LPLIDIVGPADPAVDNRETDSNRKGSTYKHGRVCSFSLKTGLRQRRKGFPADLVIARAAGRKLAKLPGATLYLQSRAGICAVGLAARVTLNYQFTMSGDNFGTTSNSVCPQRWWKGSRPFRSISGREQRIRQKTRGLQAIDSVTDRATCARFRHPTPQGHRQHALRRHSAQRQVSTMLHRR